MQPELNFAEEALNSTRGDQQPVNFHAAVTRNLDSRLAHAQVDTHGLSRCTAVFAMSFLCQWEGEGLPWHWRVQTGTLRSFQRPNPHLFRTQSHKALFVFDLVCRTGWKEVMVGHNTLSHRGGPPCCKQDLITYQRLQALSINWLTKGQVFTEDIVLTASQ